MVHVVCHVITEGRQKGLYLRLEFDCLVILVSLYQIRARFQERLDAYDMIPSVSSRTVANRSDTEHFVLKNGQRVN
jgi:hypothetical protein